MNRIRLVALAIVAVAALVGPTAASADTQTRHETAKNSIGNIR